MSEYIHYGVSCDKCRKVLAEEASREILHNKIKKRKWYVEGKGFRCPSCKGEEERK